MKAETDLERAAIEASGLDGDDGKCLALAIISTVNLLATHWTTIKNVSDDPEAKGQVKVAVGLTLDFSGKTPCGAVNISFSQKFKDGSTFRVEDKDQKKLFTES